MAKFTFGKAVDIHWNGYEIVGPALTTFSIPDQLYEEFEGDFRDIEPSLTWIDTNEFLTLQNAVSVTTLEGSFPILVTATSSGKIVSVSSSAANDGYVLTANGSGGVAWESLPADATGITNIVGTSPISAAVSGTQATISIDQSLLTAGAATTSEGIRTYVKNTTGSTILKGSAVYITGATGDNALIGLASATTEATSSKTLGLVYQDIPTDSFGYVVEAGYFTGIDTSSASAGSAVWLGNAPGSLVFVSPPAEPSNSVYLGVVVRSQLVNGTILVKVQNGYEIDELHDVSAGSPTDLDILQYKNSSGLWTKASIANAGIAASTHTHPYQTAGTYVNAVIGTSPVSVDTSSGTATVSIIAASINSTHIGPEAIVAGDIAANAVTSGNIAAGAVGTAALSSGSATSGQILTANGSGAASFQSLIAAQFEVDSTAFSSIVINGNSSSVFINYSSVTSASSVYGPFAIDEQSDIIISVINRNVLRKATWSTGVVISTNTYTALAATEDLTDIEFSPGSSASVRNFCIVTGANTSTASTVKYYIVDQSAMTVKNNGNISGATGGVNPRSIPSVNYDTELGEFTIRASYYTGTVAGGQYRGILRTLHPTTYATRVHQFTVNGQRYAMPFEDGYPSATASAPSQFSNLIYLAAYSGWIGGNVGGSRYEFFTDSGASTEFLTFKSFKQITSPSDTSLNVAPRRLILSPGSNTSIYAFGSVAGDANDLYYTAIDVSSISFGFTTTIAGTLPFTKYFNAQLNNYSISGIAEGSYINFDVKDIGGTRYIGAPNLVIIDDNFYTNSMTNLFVRPLGNIDLGQGNQKFFERDGVARWGYFGNTGSPNNTYGLIVYNIPTPTNINVVSQSSTKSTLMGLGSISGLISPGTLSTLASTSAATYQAPTSSSLVEFSYMAGTGLSISLLKPGFTYTVRIWPTYATANSTVTLNNYWFIK